MDNRAGGHSSLNNTNTRYNTQYTGVWGNMLIGQMPRLSLIKATPLQRLHRRLHEYKTAELGLVILFDRHFNNAPHVFVCVRVCVVCVCGVWAVKIIH